MGDHLVLQTAAGGAEILHVTYQDTALANRCGRAGISLVPRIGGPPSLDDPLHLACEHGAQGISGTAGSEPVRAPCPYSVSAAGLEIEFVTRPAVPWSLEFSDTLGRWRHISTTRFRKVSVPIPEDTGVRFVRAVPRVP